jgi:predicted metal-dependent hydrolase
MLPDSVHPSWLVGASIGAMLACSVESQPMTFDWTEGALAEGLRLYDAGEFFTAHEAWESVWLKAPEPEKTFLQGLIQVTAAFHHFQRNNSLGTVLLLQAALRRLDRYPPGFGGISVTLVCDDVRECLRTLEAGETELQIVSPRIQRCGRIDPQES